MIPNEDILGMFSLTTLSLSNILTWSNVIGGFGKIENKAAGICIAKFEIGIKALFLPIDLSV